MSEFGNETATAALRMGEKSIEALLKFFQFVLEKEERKLKKQQIAEAKLKGNQRVAKIKVDGSSGFVKAKLLQKTGEPLVAINIELSNKQLKDFSRYAKKYGIPFTSISEKNKDGDKTHTFFVREKDLSVAKAITDRMTEDLQLKAVDDKIAEIKNKSESEITEQDINDIKFLQSQKENIIKNGMKNFNNDNANVIFEDVCKRMSSNSMAFERSLNRFTDRDFSQDKPYYICDRTTPTSFIELKSSLDEFKGEKYTKTDYKVFKSDVLCGEFTDERFEGRPKNYWINLREQMKSLGEFTDDIIIFNSKKEIEEYKTLYKTQQKELSLMNKDNKNYENIVEELKKQLDINNAELVEVQNEKIVVDKNSQKPLMENIMADVKIDEKMRIAESFIIGKQIQNYDLLSKTKVALAMNKFEIENTPIGSEKYNTLAIEIEMLEEKIKNALSTEEELIAERSQINGVQAQLNIELDKKDCDINQEAPNNSLKQWKEKIEKVSENSVANSKSKTLDLKNNERM